MNKIINKNFIKQILATFFIILAVNYAIHICLGSFSQEGYQKYYHSLDYYLPEYNDAIVERLFANYEQHINTDGIPKTFKEYKSSDFKDNTKLSYNSVYNEFAQSYFNIVEYFIYKKQIQQLEPKIHKNLPYVKADLYPYKDIQLFYNKYGELIYIIKEKDFSKYYIYNINGKLYRIIIQGVNDRIAYNSEKQILYLIDNWNCLTIFNRYITYPEYLIKLNLFIFLTTLLLLLIFILFKLCKIYDFPPKVNDEYLNNFQCKKNYKNPFQYIYYLILKTKIHFWSHIIMLIGWACLGWLIIIFIPFANIFGFLSLTLASIILLAFIIIESIFFRKFRIKWRFIYENKIYNIIWHVGIIGYITFVVIFIKYIQQIL